MTKYWDEIMIHSTLRANLLKPSPVMASHGAFVMALHICYLDIKPLLCARKNKSDEFKFISLLHTNKQ